MYGYKSGVGERDREQDRERERESKQASEQMENDLMRWWKSGCPGLVLRVVLVLSLDVWPLWSKK